MLQLLYGVSAKHIYMTCMPQTLIGYDIPVTLLYTHGEAYCVVLILCYTINWITVQGGAGQKTESSGSKYFRKGGKTAMKTAAPLKSSHGQKH